MISAAFGLDSATSAGLLVDTNLLVLFAVGTVNRNRIETFKRTCQYTKAEYDLLVRVLGNFERLYTVAHVLAEVSNLTDLPGAECHFQNYLARFRQHYLACLVFLRGGAGGLARSRQTVAGWILNSRAASAAVLSPVETIFLISACC